MRLQRKLPSNLEAIPSFIQETLAVLATHLALNDNDRFDLKLVLEEALSNAIRHGNRGDSKKMVTISVVLQNNILRIKVTDEGKGFNSQQIPDPTAQANLLRTSGRGVYLIKKIMDKTTYLQRGRTLVMEKYFGRRPKPNPNKKNARFTKP